ncbi:hypothetical protein M0R88_10235 [Halorussus gelatinilyticus]|uniref:MYM-type domain-containing protein n=1 Tax=Halorussus gelatinilyticus TaxID=2937524 RepID=A0A8U0ICY5_9EURY|nr:hypothetical protein [Halorussus gelatinilyticus]UPV98909.1 hypothetical protein M0R88_10235 [Halorussus gelatinilyticus]
MTDDCTYCGSDVSEHDALFVAEQRGDEREPTGQFCNYACLSAHIDEENLVEGTCCRIDI